MKRPLREHPRGASVHPRGLGPLLRAAWLPIAILAALVAMEGCKAKKREPVPGPQSQPARSRVAAPDKASTDPPSHRIGHHGVGGIYWFQGTLEEAFSASFPPSPPALRY